MTPSVSSIMTFSINTADLVKQLQIVNGAIGTNTTLPILEDFLFTFEDGKLTIAATDLETSMTTQLDVNASEDGSIAIPAKMLMDILKSLPDQPLTFEIDQDNQAIEIKATNGIYKLQGELGEDFPIIPETEEDVQSITLTTAVLGKAISQTLFAVSNDELRPAMTGVYLKLNSEGLTFVATDAQKLVRFMRTDQTAEEMVDFIIPRKALALIKAALPSGEGDVKISFNETNAFFSFSNTHLVCRLIDARYPKYEAVIPVNNPKELTISRKSLQSSLKRMSIFANKTTYEVVFNLNETNLDISTQDLDFSNEARESLDCQYDGEPMEIAFNAKFLLEVLNALTIDEICLKLSLPSKAGIIVPAEQENDEDLLMLVMPIMRNI